MSFAVSAASWHIGEAAILDEVTFCAEPGECIGVVGPNGSGKSSLLRLLAGLRKPSSGSVKLDGVEVAALPLRARSRRIALVEQEVSADVDMTVMEVVMLGRTPYHRTFERMGDADRTHAELALQQVGLQLLATRSWQELSGGQRQRTSIARALCQHPSELLLDEFTNHLDIRHQLQVLDLLADANITVIAALHDLNLAAAYCDRVLLLNGGTVEAFGSPAEVFTAERLSRVYATECEVTLTPEGVPRIGYGRLQSRPVARAPRPVHPQRHVPHQLRSTLRPHPQSQFEKEIK
ncbi:iron complex transport system ATP-binding protein [Leucobacter exalbidus]|uniref:Iron complex transport system ATP-binding protein n=1 Tax=Leucobacter exalbidus TaxID=662960 RepID=A0A940PSB5_9MICO|nr:ABC transporter ATP-binding protein [Leucobacter exalbidus]MBP1325325.1 iron complex transport system ATP-binding protein [Leucobacter exalbidus]